MADHLAQIYGTEKDKVNCSFYFKIGACRHGEKCSRKHSKPKFSQTVLLPNLYQNPANLPGNKDLVGCKLSKKELQQDFDLFYEDIFMELAKYGEIEEMHVCDNVGDHLVGNVYVRHLLLIIGILDSDGRYKWEEEAGKAHDELNQRFYAGRPLYVELSPVTDFREACCRQYELSECTRGGFCNFMHLKPVTPALKRELFEAQKLSVPILFPDKVGKGNSRGGYLERLNRGENRGDRGPRDDRRRDDRGFGGNGGNSYGGRDQKFGSRPERDYRDDRRGMDRDDRRGDDRRREKPYASRDSRERYDRYRR